MNNCPVCGSEPVLYEGVEGDGAHYYQVECEHCMTTGPRINSYGWAEKMWDGIRWDSAVGKSGN